VSALRARLRDQRGYSLVELIAVMAIMGTVLAALTGLFVSGMQSQVDLDNRVRAQNDAVTALSRLRRDVHCARAAATTGTSTLTLTTSCVPSGSVTWCATLTSAGRYALRRSPTSACSASSQLFADYVVASTIFSRGDRSDTTLAKAKADFAVRTPEMGSSYRLCSVLVLRNSAQEAAVEVPTEVVPCPV
jgi:prepilin-type N-terminal cleavage/methylation domain-containing protein